MTFVYTEKDAKIALWTAVGFTIPSLIGSLVILGIVARISMDRTRRSALRRQSLQMLISVQVAAILYSVGYILEEFILWPTNWCTVAVVMTLWASNYIDFCIMLIPVNLQLTLVHGIRTEGFAKYYMGGAFLASAIIAIPGVAVGVWGWDNEAFTCWTIITDPGLRNAWEMGSYYAWILLSMAVATISTAVVVVYLLRYNSSEERRIVTSAATTSSTHSIIRGVAWRLTIYPIILIVNNTISTASNFALTAQGGINTQTMFNLWMTSGVFYGIVPLMFALTLLFVDPTFSRVARYALTGQDATWSQGIEMRTSTRGAASTLQIEFSRQVVTVGELEDQQDEQSGKAGYESEPELRQQKVDVELTPSPEAVPESEGPFVQEESRSGFGGVLRRRLDAQTKLQAALNQL